MIDEAQELATQVGVTRACEVLTVPRSSFYRPKRTVSSTRQRPPPAQVGRAHV